MSINDIPSKKSGEIFTYDCVTYTLFLYFYYTDTLNREVFDYVMDFVHFVYAQ